MNNHSHDRGEIGELLLRIAVALERIAEATAPPIQDKVGTPYVAKKLGCTSISPSPDSWHACASDKVQKGLAMYIETSKLRERFGNSY